MADIQIDLTKCDLDEMLNLIGGDMEGPAVAKLLRKVIVNAKSLTGAQLNDALQAVIARVRESMNPKSAA